MAPKSSQPPSSASQKTKQKTISSFFAPKPSQTPKPAPAPAPAPAPSPTSDTRDDNDQLDNHGSCDDQNGLVSSESDPARKRAADETNDEQTTSKRLRIADNGARRSLGDVSDTTLNTSEPLKITDRTSKFLFSSSPVLHNENQEAEEEDAEATQRQRELLHEKFVKKLGRPDSFTELRRKNKILNEE